MSLPFAKLSLQATGKFSKALNARRMFFARKYSRKACAPYKGPRCAPELLEKQPPCPSKIRRLEAKEDPPKKGMWENPECCTELCPEYYPRFDELYYKTSDKLKRKYQQTWVSCPDLIIKPRVVCKTDSVGLPPLEKRPRKARPKTATAKSMECLGEKQDSRCPRMKLSGCQGARTIPKCKIYKSPSKCQKDCPPYPSYSECKRDEISEAVPRECNCLDITTMCEVWEEMRRSLANKGKHQ